MLAAQAAVPVTRREVTHILFSFEAKPQSFGRRHLEVLVFILLFFFFFATYLTEAQVVLLRVMSFSRTESLRCGQAIKEESLSYKQPAIWMDLDFQAQLPAKSMLQH